MASKEDIERVLFDDEIYGRISDDTCPPKEVVKEYFSYGSAVFLGGYINDEIASIYAIEDNGTLHYMVLKPYRKYAGRLYEASFKALPFQRAIVRVPTLYRGLINFAKRYGFEEVGIEPGIYIKNGRSYDRVILIKEV